MKMSSVVSEVLVTSNLNVSNDSKCTEFSSDTETRELMHSESHIDSYICTIQEDEVCEKLNKSDLDIEMCEEVLNSECAESDCPESLAFDKENLSESNDLDSTSTISENYSRKCNEKQLSDTSSDFTLSDLKNMHGTVFDGVISKCKDQLKLPLEKDETIILKSHNAENHPSKENNDPLKFTFNEFEKKETNVLSVLSKVEASTSILECQNFEQCQNIKCDKVNNIPIGEITNLLSKDSPKTYSKLNVNFNNNVLYNEGQLSDNTPDSTIFVLEKQHSLNLDIEVLKCNDEIKILQENNEAKTLENQDIKNNNTVIVTFKDQSLDIVPDLTLSVLENSHSTSLVCNISKCNSQMIFLTENDETSILKDGFEHDKKNDEFDATEFECNNKEKDDDELSLIAETDVSTIEEFEMSILDVTDNDNTTNESDEIILSSIKVEDQKTVPSIPAKSLTEKYKADEGEDMLNPSADKVKTLTTDDSDVIYLLSIKAEDKTVSNIVKVPEKPSTTKQLEDEREDLLDPRWDKIKELSTDEERYQQVKNCWKRSTVPDPNKNLTYHSFRKRHFVNTTVSQPKQQKRMASSNLNEHNAKRLRSCTYHLDHQIGQLQAEIASTKTHYSWQTNRHHDNTKVESEIRALNVARNEVLQFYKFYKGLNSRNDPTVLTLEQNLELEEIENIYSKFNQLYK